MKRRSITRILSQCSFAAALASATAAHADNIFWNNTALSWTDPFAWSPFGTPNSTTPVYFNNSSPQNTTLDSSFIIPSLTTLFNSVSIGTKPTGTLRILQGGMAIDGVGPVNISAYVVVSDGQTWNIANSQTSLNITGDIFLSNTLTLAGPGNTTINTSINNSGGTLVKGFNTSDTGTLTLNGAGDNPFLSLTMNGGSLILAKTNTDNAFAIGGDGLTLNGGTVTCQGNDEIYGGSALNINGGTLDLNGNNQTDHSAGTTIFGSGGTITNSSPNPSTVSYAAIIHSGNLTGNINLNLYSNTVTSYLSGTVNSSGSLTVNTGATLFLNGNSAVFGNTTINGILNVQTNINPLITSTTLGTTTIVGELLLNASTTVGSLNGSGSILTSNVPHDFLFLTFGTDNSDAIFSGNITEQARPLLLIKTGSGIQTLAGINYFSGYTQLHGGTLRLGNAQALSTTAIYMDHNAMLDLNGQQDPIHPFNNDLHFLDDPTILNSNPNQGVRLFSTISAGSDAIFAGPGLIVLSGSYAINNQLIVNGPLEIQTSSPNTSGGVTVNSGGYLSLDNFTGNAVNAHSQGLTINPGATVSVDPGSGDQISDNTPIILNGGTLLIQASETVASINGTGTLTINGINPTLTIGSDNSNSNIAATIIGNGLLTKIGSGNLSLSGNNAYSGGTSILTGTLIVNHPSALGTGPLAIHANTTATLNSNLNSAVTLPSLSFDGTTNAWTGALDITNNKLIIEDSTHHLATLNLVKNYVAYGRTHGVGITSSTLPANKIIVVSDNAIRLATFPNGSTNFGGTNNADANSILITATYPGDANLDGIVDLKDLQDLAIHWQQPVSDWSQADFDGNGIVALPDLQALAIHWQAGVGAGGGSDLSFSEALALIPQLSAPSSVPEPLSLSAFALAAPFFLTRRHPRVAARTN